jgi:hypothetical protein
MSEPTCIDLQARFGKRYRIGWEAGGATKGQWPEADRPWLMEIRCRFGRIFPKGGEILQAMTDRPRMGTKLRALPCVLAARGDLETVVTVHVDDIDQVLALLRPYRRRQAGTPSAKQIAARDRFAERARARTQVQPSALGSTIDTGNAPEGMPPTQDAAMAAGRRAS